VGQALADVVAEARGGGSGIRIGLTAFGGELGQRELLQGAREAMRRDPRLRVVAIGPRPTDFDDLSWIETSPCESEVFQAMESALASQEIAGALALHYPFPVGVATAGRIVTPARGRQLYLASTTGALAQGRAEVMLENALLGLAVAKSQGVEDPSLGILNLDGAPQALRALRELKERGYPVRFGESSRPEGGPILRGNDLIDPHVDVCVCDTLTGNLLTKLFAGFSSGGLETQGAGYGPSMGLGWNKVISIVSRASCAPVVANALLFCAGAVRSGLPELVKKEFEAARAAGLDQVRSSLGSGRPAGPDVPVPPAHPVDAQIPGVDVLDMESALRALWKEGIYAESAMGCTGPVLRVKGGDEERSRAALARAGYL